MKKWIGIVLMVIALFFILSNINNDNIIKGSDGVVQTVIEPEYEYGILVDSFNVIKGVVKQGQTLGEILYANHIDHPQIDHESQLKYDQHFFLLDSI